MMKGIIGKKVGMTSIFDAEGKYTPCTIIETGTCVVTQVKTKAIDGYDAVQIGYGDKKSKNTTKSELGHFSKAGVTPQSFVVELRGDASGASVGDEINLDILSEGDKITVIGTSKGKGFQGVVKRHGFSGVGAATHGQHNRLRAPGSLGACSTPSRVMKGMKMGGRMGGDRVKQAKMKIVKVLQDQGLLLIKGAIPGHKGAYVIIEK